MARYFDSWQGFLDVLTSPPLQHEFPAFNRQWVLGFFMEYSILKAAVPLHKQPTQLQ